MSRIHISSSIKNRMRMFENLTTETAEENASNFVTDSDDQLVQELNSSTFEEERTSKMMMSSPPRGVQTDAEGLILPKKLINPCLESTDRKQLHRELKFNNKVGKNVLNQKTELQRAYEKQKEKQLQHNQQQQEHSPTAGLNNELNRVIMERQQKHESRNSSSQDEDEDKQYVNPEYLNVRAKLRHGQRTELK